MWPGAIWARSRWYIDTMPKRPWRPRDPNQLAAYIVKLATEGEPETPPDTRDPAAVARGKLGGVRGGRARAEKLTAAQRASIAKKAAAARWGKA